MDSFPPLEFLYFQLPTALPVAPSSSRRNDELRHVDDARILLVGVKIVISPSPIDVNPSPVLVGVDALPPVHDNSSALHEYENELLTQEAFVTAPGAIKYPQSASLRTPDDGVNNDLNEFWLASLKTKTTDGTTCCKHSCLDNQPFEE